MLYIEKLLRRALSLVLVACAAAVLAEVQANGSGCAAMIQEREEAASLISQLGSRDTLVRQRAAEELARRADTDQLKLVEGYRLQEKKAEVKAALDWALYRMGKNESLFALVRALDSAQGEQVSAYLKQLDSPQPLYIFIGQTKRGAQVRLLEVLAEIGDAETLERIKPALESFEPGVAAAAEIATERIGNRLAEQAPAVAQPTRPRQVGSKSAETTP